MVYFFKKHLEGSLMSEQKKGLGNVELTDEEFNALEDALNSLKVYGHRGLGGF